MQLCLVRHAQPVVATGICYGALNVAADAQATLAAAHRLALALPQGTHVLHSPALRCAQLAQQLQALRHDLAVQCEPDLREMDFGAWEGQAWDAINPAELKAWTDDFEHYRCGGHGESAGAVVRRVYSAGQRTAQLPVAHVAWITHAGVLRAIAWLNQRPLVLARPEIPLCLSAGEWPQHALPFGQWQWLEWPIQTPRQAPAG
jgi:alpha-ribazole phosphatase